ncbi:MAG: NAD(+)/NADH kinase [Tissierellia bacterium]|nr:NAD(+)/NADH kinase [Tissierellia bacterium]
MQRIYVYTNRVKRSLQVKAQLMEMLRKAGFVLSKNEPDLILVVGGDGTMLSAIRTLDHLNVPFLGVNTGSLGFLPGILPSEIEILPKLLSEETYYTEKYPTLEVKAKSLSGKEYTSYCFNEVLVKQHQPRLLEILIYLNGKPFNYYTGDGLIVSTPIGTTGYAIWTGGAAIESTLEAYQITPIHPNDNRINRPLKHSLIMPLSTKIELKVVRPQYRSVLAAVDGIYMTEEYLTDLTIRISDRPVSILRAHDTTYFDLFRNKIVDKNIYRYLENPDENR